MCLAKQNKYEAQVIESAHLGTEPWQSLFATDI